MNNSDRHKLFLVLVLLLPLSSCKDASVDPYATANTLTYIEGKLPNWAFGDSITLLAGQFHNLYGRGDSFFIFGTTHVGRDGSFLLTLAPPPAEILIPYPHFEVAHCYSFLDSAHFIFTEFCLRRPNDSTNFKYIYNKSTLYAGDYDSPAQAGDYWTFVEYVDRDVNMVCNYDMHLGTSPGLNVSVQEHLNYKKGWNRIVSTKLSVMDYSRTIERSIRNSSDGKWDTAP